MLDKIFSFFSPRSAAPADTKLAPAAAPTQPQSLRPAVASPADTSIKRDEGMVKKLTDDHRALLTVYGQVMREADAGQWQSVQQKLLDFQALLTDHLLLESVKVYSYLKNQYKNDEAISGSIQDFSTEMNGIRKHVVTTIASFSDISVDTAKQKTFPELWRSIGIALGNRIQREEKSLYPLY
jgi:hemerythrin superfamily protein